MVKYPRTYHLPWSPGWTNNDRVMTKVEWTDKDQILITEKMDGENTTLYRDNWHARSLSSPKDSEWRTYVNKLFYERVYYQIPDRMRICGENMYAKHSIHYKDLEDYFLVFSIWNGDWCLSWEDTKVFAKNLGLSLVPVIGFGNYNEKYIKTFNVPETSEGYVIRPYGNFHYTEFNTAVGKYVRENHIQTTRHWTKEYIIKNEINSTKL